MVVVVFYNFKAYIFIALFFTHFGSSGSFDTNSPSYLL